MVTREKFTNSNGKEYLVLKRSKDNNCLLACIKGEENEYTPFIAAWQCPKEKGSWGQGHYFETLDDAYKYYQQNYAD